MRFFLALFILSLLTSTCKPGKKVVPDCSRDTIKVKAELLSIKPDSIFTRTNFYELGRETNRQLWFNDIESIDSTQFTRLWDDYHENNFRASHTDFKEYYRKSANTELAFQIGPSGPLWTYFTFVLKKHNCCYLISRTNFAHARFRYKAYSFISQSKVDSIFGYLGALKRTKITEDDSNYIFMSASFIDNKNNEVFDVLLEEYKLKNQEQVQVPPDSTILKFMNFIDSKIKWTKAYPLDRMR